MRGNKSKKKATEIPRDQHVITAVNGKASTKKCGNPECYIRDNEVPLKACARCKSMRYCSRECQSVHWQRHKAWCNGNMDHAAGLATADAIGIDFGLPKGLTLLQLDQKLEKWVNFHNNLLMAATIHALELPRDIKRSRSYLLHIQISHQIDNDGVNARAFRFIDASVIDMESAMARGGVWPLCVDQIKTMREESEALRRGTVAAVALECEPLAVQTVPFGSLRDLSPLKIQKKWKEMLRRDIEAGKKFTRFEMTD